MKSKENYANATLVVKKNENYSIIKGEVNLTPYRSIITNVRFSDFLNNPNLVSKTKGLTQKKRITVKTGEFEEQTVNLSDIVIATESKDYRWNQIDKMLAIRYHSEKEPFSSSTEDGKYQIKGHVFNLAKQIKDNNNFIIASDNTSIRDFLPEKTDDKDYATINDSVKTSKHNFIAINPKYFKKLKK